MRRTSPGRMELRLQFQNAAEQLENPLYPSARGSTASTGGGWPRLLLHFYPFPGIVPYLTPISTVPPLPPVPFAQSLTPRPALSLSLSPSFTHPVVSHGTGIRIVISNRATTHEPLPCRSKFVNGLWIPGLRRGSP